MRHTTEQGRERLQFGTVHLHFRLLFRGDILVGSVIARMGRIWMSFIFGFVVVFTQNAICNALVEVSIPVERYWGSDGGAELEISSNVSSTAGWESVTVTATTPDGRNFPATTENDNSSAPWKIYTHTIKALFIDDAGTYTFSAEEEGLEASGGGTDSSDVTVYIYTISVLHTATNYYVVERTEQLSISLNVKTDGDWNTVSVVVESPDGETLETTFSELEVSFWRTYTATIENIVQGTYNFIASETLGSKNKSISSAAVVEVSESTVIDEYLFRIDKTSQSITDQIPNFYKYIYDGPDNTYILDGGKDMYDRGNYLTVRTNSTETLSVPYGKPYTFENFMFSSIASYPFTALMWISNEDAVDDAFSIQVTGQTGSTVATNTEQYKSQFSTLSSSVNYRVVQVFGEITDPSICEVYFYITNEEGWSSVAPSSAEFDVAGVLPKGIDNTYTVHGAPKNIMMGYMLLSRDQGKQVEESDIVKMLENVTTIIEEKDGFTMESVERVTTEASSITLKTKVMTAGSWNDIIVEVETPEGSTSILTEFSADGDARQYLYEITDLSESDTGVYTFTATDNFGFTKQSTTALSVVLAQVLPTTPEYWSVNGDEELIISVNAIADSWTNTEVVVKRPDGEVYGTTMEAVSDSIRTYTYRVTNLFIEDAGEYVFTTETNGVTSSHPAIVTVYLFTVATYPENFHSHAVEKESKVLLMVYVACDSDWANVKGIVTTPNGNELPMTSVPGAVPSIRVFYSNVTGVTGGDYNITITENLGARSKSKSSKHTVEIHNSTYVDEYLYRIGLISDELISYVDGWQNYWYDGPDSTFITDGGFDMYDKGNYISLIWSSGEEINIPYGKPFENDVVIYSSKNFYPFVSLLWIDNRNRSEEEFAITVQGKSGMHPTGKHETFRRILFEGTYDVTYHVFQTFDAMDPSICEVYFLITNTDEWNSILPDKFDLTIGGTPPQILHNMASVTGSPSNIMLGYTLLSKDDGAKVDYLEVEKVVEQYVAVIAERDQFRIKPTTDDGVYLSVAGESAEVEAVVSTSGKWDGITVEVVLPNGVSKPVTDYELSNLHTQRIYRYFILSSQYSDKGNYVFIVTDKYGEQEETVSTLHVFTLQSYATTTQYAGGEGDTVVMEIYVTTENYLLLTEIDTPTLGTLPVTDWTDDWTDVRTYRHKIENPTYEVDNGKYTFRITEVIYEKYEYPTTVEVDLAVFSVSTLVDDESYTVNAGDEILEISVDVSTFGDWDAVQVTVMTPERGTQMVTEFDTISDTRRRYIFEMRNIGYEDSGSYVFVATETLYGETKSSEIDTITVEVKASDEKLSGGEIAGVVIGSVAGAALLCGLAWYCLKNPSSQIKPSSDSKYNDNKGFDLEEKSSQPDENNHNKGFDLENNSPKPYEDDGATAL